MTWLASSVMGRRGVAQGREGSHHELTEAAQGRYHYVYGPYADPVMRIAPGDVVAVSEAFALADDGHAARVAA